MKLKVIKLNRKNIFIIGLVTIALFLFINRLDYIFNSNISSGQVIDIKTWFTRGKYGGSYSVPIIVFYTDTLKITFQGVTNMDLKIGESVDVIYKTSKPTDAKVYSFIGFWFLPVFYCIIPFMLLNAIVFSFLSVRDRITIDFNTFFKWRK